MQKAIIRQIKCATLLLLISYSTISCAAPKVVVSIKPIHSLVANIMQGVATPELLLPDYASPHTFQLKPSDLKQLQTADLIIWVSPTLETFLEKPLAGLNPPLGMIALENIPGLTHLPYREVRDFSEAPTHQHEGIDPHLWLSIDNAMIIADFITEYLAQKDPLHEGQYRNNAKYLKNDLKRLKKQLTILLTPVQNKAYIVYHDGYQYFEKEFNLNSVGTMVINPHLPLSAHGLKTIQNLVKTHQVRCLFYETEFNDKSIPQHLKKLGVKTAELDPLGAKIPQSPKAYEQTMLTLGQTLHECLSKK